ncbi:hypothetical protein PQR02_39940, partial [Paraburkholderia sediminicola]
MQLLGRQLDHGLLPGWPREMVYLEAFQHQPEARTLVQQQLNAVAFAIMEREHGASEGVELHRLLNQRREAINSRPKVNRFAMQIDAKVGIKAEHQRSPSAAINAVTSVASCREHSSS